MDSSCAHTPQVIDLLLRTGNIVYGWLSIAILLAQFVVVYARVWPYLHGNFGPDSLLFKMWVILGFPLGCLFLDCLMFLEPFGLLSVLPLEGLSPRRRAAEMLHTYAPSTPPLLLSGYRSRRTP